MRSVNTIRTYLRSIAFILAASLTLAPAYALATSATTSRIVQYATSMRPINSIAYPVTGRLQISTSSDGIVTGYYRPAYDDSFIPVNGGVEGDRVWLDIGRTGAMRVTGRLVNGTIVGSATTPHGGIMEFVAGAPQIEQTY
jgi:hypothetical protein